MKKVSTFKNRKEEDLKNFKAKFDFMLRGEMSRITAEGWAAELKERAQKMRARFQGYKDLYGPNSIRGNNPGAWDEIKTLEDQADEVEEAINLIYVSEC